MQCPRKLLRMLWATVLLLLFATSLQADQTITGDCNVVLGDQNKMVNITVICLPKQESTVNFAPLILEISVEGLMAGATSFDLIMKNKTSYATALFTPAWLSMQDDQGTALGTNCLHPNMDCVSEQYVRPDGTNRFNVYLQSPIPPDTTDVSFLLQGIRYLSNANTSAELMGFTSWTVPIEIGTAPLQCRERLTCEEQARIQLQLRELGYEPERVDGVFDAATRSAIRNWQQDDPGRRVSPPDGCVSHRDALRFRVDGVLTRFSTVQFDRNCKGTDTDQNRDQLAEPVPPNVSVKDMQTALARIGFYQGGIDGVWGDESSRALIAAQKKIDVEQTGTIEDGMRLLNQINALPDPPACNIRFSYFDGELFAEPDHFSIKIGDVPQRSMSVLDQRPGQLTFWFQINTGQRIGWVKDFGHITVSGSDCRQP